MPRIQLVVGDITDEHVDAIVNAAPGPEEASRRERLVAAHRNSLGLATMIGAQSVAVPAISAGVYGWPIDEVAETALTVAAGAEPSAAPPLVRFVLFGDRAARAYRDAAARLGIAVDEA